MFVVTLRGEYVFHNCSLQFIIKDTKDETLNKVKEEIERKCNLKVFGFARKYGIYVAETDYKDIKVFIESVDFL